MEFKYGMRLRGFSIGCQPKKGFIRREDDDTGKYHDFIIYDRPLTVEEVRNYELDRLFGYADIKKQCQEEVSKLPLNELMKDTGFAETAFYYEMGNHEYHINWQGDWEVCNCFGNCEYEELKDYTDYLKEIGFGDEIILAYKKAKARFLHDADENEWY